MMKHLYDKKGYCQYLKSKKQLSSCDNPKMRSPLKPQVKMLYQDPLAVSTESKLAWFTNGNDPENYRLEIKGISANTEKCFSLGMYIDKPKKTGFAPGFGMHRYCTDAKYVSSVFRKPVSYTEAWKNRCGSLWLVNCPVGFVSLGSVAINQKDRQMFNKDFPDIRCLNWKYAEQTAYED